MIRGDQVQARRLFGKSLAIHRSLGDAWGASHSLANLALLAFDADDVETARTLLSEALGIQRETGNQRRLAAALEISARLAIADGQPMVAVRLYARAALLREVVGTFTFDLGWPDPAPTIEALRSGLGESTFREHWERGRALSLLEAIDQAMGTERELAPAHAPHNDERVTAASRPTNTGLLARDTGSVTAERPRSGSELP
jgi:hypothetical protein